MRIKDITLRDIRAGLNWRVTRSQDREWPDQPIEEWQIDHADRIAPNDSVVYSGVYVTEEPALTVTAIVLVKELQDLDYGGDYCEFVAGSWSQVGIVPNPNAVSGTEYIADPLTTDPSFDSPDHDYRKWHRDRFREFSRRLEVADRAIP
jgi:hypothetical protein